MNAFTPHISASIIMRSMVIGVLGGTLLGCSDDSIITDGTDSRTIRFNVSARDTWQDGTTRTFDSAPGVITLRTGDEPLYLVPTVKDGISRQAASRTTRGTLLNSSTIASAGVFASIVGASSGPDYMCNEEITSTGNWTLDKEYHWLGEGKLHFNAYSPFTVAGSEEGITSIPTPADTGDLQISYTVPAVVADQPDLMWATPVDASASPCDLTFNHALTAIRFSTGTEMTQCKIVSVAINGVKNSGILNIETGEWSDLSGEGSYTVEPNLTLVAAEGDKYVAPGTPVTDGDDTFILMPQTLEEGASISLTVESSGKTVTLNASLDGQIWDAGKTIVYRLSANPDPESLTLDVAGNFGSTYTGGTDEYTVKSYFTNGEDSIPVKWIAEFVDDAGNVIDQPNWISKFITSGTGTTDCAATTVMQDLVFDKISPQTQILQNAADINQSSGFTPYNLSSSSGSPNIENTANTYIINAPGKYSLPLVYGNAVKSGAENTAAYTTSSHTHALKDFVNHLGNGITDPYIYNNSGCTPADAVLIWEDELNMVRNVALSSDGKSIEFDIPHNTIRQGNALVAVRDSKGEVMWSWQLWITDYVLGTGVQHLSSGSHTVDLYPRAIGEVYAGDVTTFTPMSVKVRFTQQDVPDGLEPLVKTLEFTQTGITISTPECFSYYQWGRKDPMMSGVKQWYNADHKELTEIPTMSVLTVPSGEIPPEYWTLHPEIFWTSDINYKFKYFNLWNVNNSTTKYVKTIYDPSPVGAMVPSATAMRYIVQNATVEQIMSSTADRRAGFYVTLTDGTQLYFAPLGYRSSRGGTMTYPGEIGSYWCNESLTNYTEARAIIISNTVGQHTIEVIQEPRGDAFGIRPMAEP